MAIGADFEIQNDKDIRYTGTTDNYTVLELHRWLQDLADDASTTPDDFLDITRDTPSDKQFDTIITLTNGYNIDATAAQHLYGGSIIQSAGAEIWDGIQVLAPAGMRLEIIQDGALITPNFWTTGLNADAANGISHQFMVKVRTGGADTDGRRLIGTTREFNSLYLEFKINGTSRGVNVMAFTGFGTDLNNPTAAATVADWTDVVNLTVGYNGIDVNNDTTNEFYYSKWDRASRSINGMYERLKWVTRRGTAETIYGLSGDLFRGITHEITVSSGTGTWGTPEHEPLTWTGGTGRLLAVNDKTGSATTKLWMQLLTGVAPTNTQVITGTTSTATATASGSATERSVSAPFLGQSTGTSIIGAFGFGVEATDLGTADKVFDLTNTQYSPPNFVTFTVGGIVSGDDRVLVGPADGSALDLDQMTLDGALTGASVTSVVVNGSIPSDTPSSATGKGGIRILRVDGSYSLHAYTAWSGSTFTIPSHDFSTNNAANSANVFIAYIDKLAAATSESFTGVYLSDRSLFIRVRDGGPTPIKTFESTGTLGSAGGSSTAVRTSDA
jgi:hypothetical protein